MEKKLIIVIFESLFISFQGIGFNGNRVFLLFPVPAYKGSRHLLSCLCNETRALLIGTMIRLEHGTYSQTSLCKISMHFTWSTPFISVHLNLYSTPLISHGVLSWRCVIDDMCYVL